MQPYEKEEALAYHRLDNKPGKIEVVPTKPLENQKDLSLAYTPGVAYPVLAIEEDPLNAYEYTAKGNLVAVITNGTAILGLGNRGPLASKPVMEGKAALFKKFAYIDVFDLEINESNPDKLIEIILSLEPTFGGINLEDIKSPECFYIEQKLVEQMSIPVFHDDQHGTAIILGAALMNALELTSKKWGNIKVVFSGAGAAAVACARHLLRMGIPRENIWMCDIEGLVYNGRIREMFNEKSVFAQGNIPATLAQTIPGADVFIGLSVGNILTPDMLLSMGSSPIVFAMANPIPEISYELAKQIRPDAIVATGRSDYPNQINNLLGFPYIFRGALDVRSRKITEAMKISASIALAELTKLPVPEQVLRAYNVDHLEFGPGYIIPKPFDPRLFVEESYAVAKTAVEQNLARVSFELSAYRQSLISIVKNRNPELY